MKPKRYDSDILQGYYVNPRLPKNKIKRNEL